MASEGMQLPQQQKNRSWIVALLLLILGWLTNSSDTRSRSTTTGTSGASGWGQFFVKYVLWVLIASIISAILIWLSLSHGTWAWYLSAEISSALAGILFAAKWIIHDRAKAQTSLKRGSLDQLGFFNSRLAKRSRKLFEIATKEVTRESSEVQRQQANALVAQYWKAEGAKSGKPSEASSVAPKTDGKDDELMKILQPEYAIGMQIISRDDYTAEMNEYFAQSELSLGLIVPLILVVLGLVLTPQIGLKGELWVLMCSALAPISGVLFFIGMERWQKYRMELKLLILGNWERLQAAKKQPAPGNGGAGSSKAVQGAIVKAIEATTEGKGNVKVDINIKA